MFVFLFLTYLRISMTDSESISVSTNLQRHINRRSIKICRNIKIQFHSFLWLSKILCIYALYFFIHLSTDIQVVSKSLLIVNTAAINILVHIVLTMIQPRRSGFVGSLAPRASVPEHMKDTPIAHLKSPGNFLAISGTEI